MRRSQETPEESLILNYLRQGIDAGFSMTVEFACVGVVLRNS